jgi:alkanesulfonate monooxygenase SsuD/methylene tetrahydromethanopterin reductase-like flavin-dependent oxidoreductase (luciferase family)
MPDYGQPLQFGYFLIPDASDIAGILRLAHQADDLGLDLIGVQDHPYQRRFLDTWMLLPAIAAQTRRVRIFPDVASLPLRPPAVLAKAAASLDLLSSGRFELGLGAGAFWDAIVAMGGPRRSPGEALAALEEALAVLRLMWSDQRGVRFAGQYYSLAGVHPGPQPAHPINIWIGATGPKMLNLIGRKADGWVPSSAYVTPERLPALQRIIDVGIQSAGRDPASVRRIYNVMGHISDGPSGDFLDGPVEQWVDELTALTLEQGMDTYIFAPSGDAAEQLVRFANEVIPAVRERVARVRGAAVTRSG